MTKRELNALIKKASKALATQEELSKVTARDIRNLAKAGRSVVMFSRQVKMAKIKEKAQAQIVALGMKGYKVSEATVKRAYAGFDTRYSAEQVKKYQELLSESFIKKSAYKEYEFTQPNSKDYVIRLRYGNEYKDLVTAYNKMLTDTTFMQKTTADMRAVYLRTIEKIGEISGVDTLPKGVTVANINQNVDRIKRNISKAARAIENDPTKKQQVETRLFQGIKAAAEYVGADTEAIQAYRAEELEKQKRKFGQNFSLSDASIEKFIDFFETSSNWTKFRKKIDSDEFVENVSTDIMREEAQNNNDIDWQLLDALIGSHASVRAALNAYATQRGLSVRF